jgi:hypothetical protein
MTACTGCGAKLTRTIQRCTCVGSGNDAGGGWHWRPDSTCCFALVGRRPDRAQARNCRCPMDPMLAACLDSTKT